MQTFGVQLTQLDLNAWLETARDFALPRLLQSAGLLLLAAAIYFGTRWVIRRVESRLTSVTETNIDDKILVLLSRVLGMSVGFWLGWRLTQIWELPRVETVVTALWLLALAFPLSRFVREILNEVLGRLVGKTDTKLDDTALPLVTRVVGFMVVGFGSLMALQQLGVSIAPFLGGAGVVGIALSLAAKDSLANLLAGVQLILDRPFEVGDRIEIWNTPKQQSSWGDVAEIGLRATKIRTTDNIVIIIPNSVIMTRDIVNWTASGDDIRLRIPIGIGYDADVELAKKVILDVVSTIEGVKLSPKPEVILRNFGESSVDMQIRVWIENARNRRRVDDEVTERVKLALDASGIKIPYPRRDINVLGGKTLTPSSTSAPEEKTSAHE